MAVTTAPTKPATRPQRPKLPEGLRWSNVWRTDAGLVEGEREVPVDAQWHVAGRLFLCPTEGCDAEDWRFAPREDGEEPPCCRRHPVHLLEVAVDSAEQNPVGSARERMRARVREVLQRRRDRVVEAARAHAHAAQQAAVEAAKTTWADLHGHRPTLYACVAATGVGTTVAASDPLAADILGAATMTGGAVLAYVAAYLLQRLRAQRVDVELIGRTGRKVRAKARRYALAALCAGAWLLLAGLLGVNPATTGGDLTWALAPVLAWLPHKTHWEILAADRRRVKALAAQKAAEAAARAQEEADRLANQPTGTPAAQVDEGPLEMGRRMAARWAEIAQSDTVPVGFLMRRTWIVAEETRELTVPDGDELVRIGWEYAIESEPGVLVARLGAASPLLAARDWLASMLGVHPSLVSLVDRPDDQVNRGLLSITDRLALGETVNWKGAGSIRKQGGAVLGHVGADMRGNDIFELIEVPGQLTGGLTVGHSGGGKSVGARVALLNDLAAGIFPVLYDPVKSLGDFSEFAGIFPMGCTPEHRDVILRALHMERHRRNKAANGRKMRDRLGRVRPEPAVFRVGKDGPHIRSYWEEFHANATDKVFLASFLGLMRVQRAVAMDSEVFTQGGGLQDLGDSVIRGLLNQSRMRLYRMPDNLARLAGYSGTYMPSQLPRVPGACLLIAEGVPVIPLRGAWVTREDEDGCVYDHLYGPDGTLLLAAPTLPKETVEVFEKAGLMDLWRMGQGPDGLANLIGESVNYAPPSAANPAGGNGSAMQAADVLLAIVLSSPGCPRADIDNHEVWKRAPGWGSAPNPSTISRKAKELVEQGLLVRGDNQYRITEKGQSRAQAAKAVLFDASPDLDAERRAEQQAELDFETA